MVLRVARTLALSAVSLAALGGCAATGETGRDLAGFPIDEKCMAFWQDSPSYHGNRTLAYAQNCANGAR